MLTARHKLPICVSKGMISERVRCCRYVNNMHPFPLAGIQKEDEGMYTCQVKNEFGSQEVSAFITVTGIGGSLIFVLHSFFKQLPFSINVLNEA